jgi:hypothetical protein
VTITCLFPEGLEFRSGVPALQNRELLAECQVLQEEDLTRMKEANEHSKPEPEEAEHRRDLEQVRGFKKLCKLLISRPDRILARDRPLLGVWSANRKLSRNGLLKSTGFSGEMPRLISLDCERTTSAASIA